MGGPILGTWESSWSRQTPSKVLKHHGSKLIKAPEQLTFDDNSTQPVECGPSQRIHTAQSILIRSPRLNSLAISTSPSAALHKGGQNWMPIRGQFWKQGDWVRSVD